MKGVEVCNLHDTTTYMKMNVLQDFHICISVRLSKHYLKIRNLEKVETSLTLFMLARWIFETK